MKNKRIKKIIEINVNTKELAKTDYKIIKCYEYSLAGKSLPYDINVLHSSRQELRNEINRLKQELNELKENEQQ